MRILRLNLNRRGRGAVGRPRCVSGKNKTVAQSARQSDTAAVDQFAAPGYEVFDLTAFVDLTSRLSLNVGLFNLLDETYWEWADVRGVAAGSAALDRYTSAGFSAAASLRWRW